MPEIFKAKQKYKQNQNKNQHTIGVILIKWENKKVHLFRGNTTLQNNVFVENNGMLSIETSSVSSHQNYTPDCTFITLFQIKDIR